MSVENNPSSLNAIFENIAPKLFENGYSVIWCEGKRTLVSYDLYRDKPASDAEFEAWVKTKPNANIGLPMGEANGMVCLDVDFAELWKYEENRPVLIAWANKIASIIPRSPFVRTGLKPWAAFYKFDNQTGGKFEANGIPIGEFITRGQVVIPPSIHPDSGKPYVWVGGCDLLDYSRDEAQEMMPEFSDLDFVKLKAELETFIDPKLITTWPDKRDGTRGTGPSDITGGRNNQLSKMALAIFEKGKSIEECAAELFREDQRMHGVNALFSDHEDFKGIAPEAAALKFAKSHHKTFVKVHAKNGTAIPDVELLTQQRAAAEALVDDLAEYVSSDAFVPANLMCSEKDVAYSSVDNVMRALEHIPAVKTEIWFDSFYQKVFTQNRAGKISEWSEIDDINLTINIQRHTPLSNVSESTVSRAVQSWAHERVRNAPRDWLESLKWDNQARLDNLFERGFGAVGTDYVSGVSANFLISMVARIFDPGCKVDTMVVLEGKQGAFKSTGLSVLGGAWFMESGEAMGSKDFLQSLPGKMLIEIAELDSFSKADTRTVKKTLSCRVDRYRPSYGRYSIDFPRQCVFVGTTNEDEYLEDATGGRRFWPIKARVVDVDWLMVNREQLFAEAVARYKANESWWELVEAASDEQSHRRRKDSWEDAVAGWILTLDLKIKDQFTLSDIAKFTVQIVDRSKFGKSEQMRLSAILKILGAEKCHTAYGNTWKLKPISSTSGAQQIDFTINNVSHISEHR